jgi:hypothetical protein
VSYAIEHDVPIPPKRIHTPAVSKYDFASLEVGDSFAVPLGTERRGTNFLNAQRLTAAAVNYKQRHPGAPGKPGWNFTVRTLKDEGVARIWRTA